VEVKRQKARRPQRAEDGAQSYDYFSAFLNQTPHYIALVLNTVRFHPLFRVSHEL